MASRPRLLLFEPHAGGHHAEHIRHLLRAWGTQAREGTLIAAVTPRLLREDPDLSALAVGGVAPVRVEPVLSERTPPLRPALRSELRLGQLLRQCVAAYRPEHVLMMYMDALQPSLAFDLRFPAPVLLSGILFGTTFRHTDAPVVTRLKRMLRRPLLSAALRNPHLRTVFSPDPSAVPDIRALGGSAEIVPLPDPVETQTGSTTPLAVRTAWGVEPDRKVLLLFGTLAERKGVIQLLNAIDRLPDQAAARICVMLAGRVTDDLRTRVPALLSDMRQTSPAQFILRDAYLPSGEVQNLVEAADLVLAPYQRHVGSSGVIIRAAAARRPVLTQDFGVVGMQVQAHRLGQAVETTDVEAIAAGILRFLDDPALGFDPMRAGAFADANSVEAYLRVLFDHVLTS